MNNNLLTFSIKDVCTPLKLEVFNIFKHEQQGKASLQQAHKHNFYMLLVISTGSGTHTIDFTTHNAGPQQVHFLAPGHAHSWELHPNTQGFQLMFGPDFLEGSPQQWPFFSYNTHPVLQLTPDQFTDIEHEMEQVNKEYNQTDLHSIRIISYRLRVLLSLLERCYEVEHPSPSRQSASRLVKQFFPLLELHYFENATVEFYAKKLHITPQYLNIVCKKEIGVTAGHCIRQRLLLEAKRLLALTGQDVKEIAYTLGFSDTSYFSRFFRRYASQNPLAFRQQINRTHYPHN